MAAKKRDGGAERAKGRAKAQQVKKQKAAVSSASFGIPGKNYEPRGTGRSMVSNPLQGNRTPVQNAGSAFGLRGMQGGAGFQPENWAKAAAIVPAGRAVKLAASLVAKTGLIPRITNRLQGQTVVVHGSPVSGISRITPRSAPADPGRGPAVYGMNPAVRSPVTRGPLDMGRIIQSYARGGSAYIAKVPTKSVTNPSSVGKSPTVGIVKSTKPAKVVSEISTQGKSAAQLHAEILRAARSAGAKIPKR